MQPCAIVIFKLLLCLMMLKQEDWKSRRLRFVSWQLLSYPLEDMEYLTVNHAITITITII